MHNIPFTNQQAYTFVLHTRTASKAVPADSCTEAPYHHLLDHDSISHPTVPIATVWKSLA